MKDRFIEKVGLLLCLGLLIPASASAQCVPDPPDEDVIFSSFFAAGNCFDDFDPQSCSTDAWNGGVTGFPFAGGPPDIPVFYGNCAMQLTAAGSVKDISPIVEPRIRLQFYFRADLNSGTPTILEAFTDDAATGRVFKVTTDGSEVTMTPFVGDAITAPIIEGAWNSVEIDWKAGGTFDLWVNSNARFDVPDGTGSSASTTSLIESVVMGPGSSLDGTVGFDSYRSRRTNAIGLLVVCDAGPINLTVTDAGSAAMYLSETEITAGSGFAVQTSEHVRFVARTAVTLQNGFSVESGARFTVTIDAAAACAT